MSKKRILLGMFMLMAMAFCGIWFNKVPSVFASQATSYATIENEAGTFTGQGYYVVGQTATLIARMNPGYQFDGWISVDIEGNKIKDLSPDIEYTFVVDDNIRIKATWSQIVYNVDFDQTLMVDGELKDFNYTINNNDDVDGNYYYGDELQLTFTTKVYIDDLSDDDIFINGNSISSLNLINSEIITQYNTDTDGLLNSFVVTFNITEDVIFNIDYNYLYRLQLLSGNTIDINKLVQFVTLTNYRAKLDDYTYLAYDNKEITLAISAGDSVYTLLGYQFEGMDVSNIYSQSYVLDKNSTFTIYYSKKNYEVGFSYHIINQYGEYDLLDEEIYNLAPISLTAGEQIEFDYNIDTKKITITDVVDSMTYEYNYPSNLYGYKFVGFAISNELLDTNAYILSDSEPSNVEIQLIFEYIEYLFEIKLVDEYFADGVEFGYTYNDGLTNLVTGMEINIYANTNKYQIKGWSWTSNPTNSDYITGITDQSNYTFTFTPNSDEMVNNTLYLDVDYKYTSITYSLNQDSIEENLNHDIVKVDLSNNKLIFSNSENVLDVQEITYLDSDITQIGDVTTITTSAFGDIIISNNSLTYSVNDLPQQSISKNTVDGVDEYVFEKYTYFGNLKVSVIEYIQLFDVNNEIIVKIYGTSYDENGANTTEIQSLTTTKTYIDAMDAYQINDFPYNVYLYMNEEDYDYIELRGVKYYYNGTNFELNHALINVPEVVQYSVIKNSQYTITLSNLLPNMLLVYSTESTDALNYSFTSFTDGKSGLVNYNYNNSVRCILATNSITSVNVEYRKLSNDITLNINNESAYQYADIQFTVAGVAGTGKTIKASNGESIIIIISSDKISKGYKFDGFMFNGDNVTNINSPNTLELTMRDIYVNQIINICFSEIEYMININYVDIDKNVLTDNIHGGLILAGQVEYVTKLSVALSGEYILNIIADNGYYVSNAYIGADEYVITDLISSNQSNLLVTSWKINNSNFVEAIINNADENNELNLYIYFAIHTYSVKVYFEIDENASLITYPDLYINNVRAQLNQRPEMIGGVTTTRYYVQDSGFEYNSKVELRANNFMLGTRFEKWTYNGYQLPQKTSSHEIDPITQDIVLTMKLQYIAYGVQFIAVDTEDNSCDYGSIVTAVTTIKLFGRIDYRVNLTQGYIWKETYYINDEGVRTNEGAEPNFIFNPANFSIENSGIKLYVVFGVKEVNINVVNEQKGSLPIIGDWATYTLSRVRGENSEMLEDSDYKFQTGDLLIMELTPVSMGIDLGMVKLSSITITSATASPYSLVAMNKVEDEKVVGIYYRLTILFSPSVMGSLPDGGVELRNILNVKTFNIVYTYNHIDYKFGVELSIKYRGGTFKAGSDEIITEPGISFGTAFTFGSSYAGMNNEITNKFKIVGYIIAGIEQQASGSFTLQDAYLWEQVALAKHMDGNNNILVVLVINPKITLNNYTDYNITSGYVYERTYIGENQGLATSGADIDVIIGANFRVGIQYSYDNGLNYSNDLPINCGQYPVKITAEISAVGKDTIYVDFDESVLLKITPASLSLALKSYSQINPISKTYDGTTNLSARVLASDLMLMGVYERDEGKIFIDENRMIARFSGASVNSALSLYNINIQDIYLLDNSNNEAINYKLASGMNLVLQNIGKINPRELRIDGFKPKNKVYDATSEVVVDISGIIYDGIIGTDSTQIFEENLKFYLDNYTIGVAREVKLDPTGALAGADSINYTITYATKYIDIHPYEISYQVQGYGTFKVVDEDRLCLIPIGAQMFANVYDKGSSEYRNYYSLVEPKIFRGEKLKICYEVVLRIGAVNQLVPQGLYIYLPKTNKVTKVLQVVDSSKIESLNYNPEGSYTVIRASEGDPIFTVVVRSTYLPLWLIILIICLSLILLAIIIFIFILIRRKVKNKYKSYDRI